MLDVKEMDFSASDIRQKYTCFILSYRKMRQNKRVELEKCQELALRTGYHIPIHLYLYEGEFYNSMHLRGSHHSLFDNWDHYEQMIGNAGIIFAGWGTLQVTGLGFVEGILRGLVQSSGYSRRVVCQGVNDRGNPKAILKTKIDDSIKDYEWHPL